MTDLPLNEWEKHFEWLKMRSISLHLVHKDFSNSWCSFFCLKMTVRLSTNGFRGLRNHVKMLPNLRQLQNGRGIIATLVDLSLV